MVYIKKGFSFPSSLYYFQSRLTKEQVYGKIIIKAIINPTNIGISREDTLWIPKS